MHHKEWTKNIKLLLGPFALKDYIVEVYDLEWDKKNS